jgi:hypothetical protein
MEESTWSRLWTRLKVVSFAQVLVGMVVALAAVGVALHLASGRKPRKPAGLGSIFVDQPEIYTRERLVNDRFEQDDWLRKRLAKVDDLTFAASGTARSARRNTTEANANAGAEAGGVGLTPADELDAGTTPAPSVDPIDDFHDRVAYREEVRTEIIENQLDDSHDLAGNTLYQLKFDATVIPRENVSAFAMVEAAVGSPIERPFDCDRGHTIDEVEFDECVGEFVNRLKWSDHERQRDKLAQAYQLYRAWLEKSEAAMNIVMRTKRDALLYALDDLNGKWADTKVLSEDARLLAAGAWLREIDLGEIEHFTKFARKALEVGDEECVAPQSADVAAKVQTLRELDCVLKPSTGTKRTRPYEAALEQQYTAWFAEQHDDTAPPDLQDLVYVQGHGSKLRVSPRTITSPLEKEPMWLHSAASMQLVVIEPRVDKDGNEVPNKKSLEKQAGFASFLSRLHRAPNRAYAYSVRPKEAVQRLATEAELHELSKLSLSVGADAGGEALKSALANLKSQSLLTTALERHPLVVGFSDDAHHITDNAWAFFGWLIGPRFQSQRGNGSDVTFAHHAVHQSLSVIVSAPAWWRDARITLISYWLTSDGRCFDDEGLQFVCDDRSGLKRASFDVRLPGDAESVEEILLPVDLRKLPNVDVTRMDPVSVSEGDGADIVIPGRNLWRSTVVVLGTQRADSIAALPDMNGIVARFNEVRLPPSTTEGPREPVLALWTSEGRADPIRNKVKIFPKQGARGAEN